jgi:hypothetical protein
MYAGFADRIRETHRFGEPDQWRFDWERAYTRDEWLALLPTTGGLTRLPPERIAGILEAVGAAIDRLGGHFTMPYTTLATTAVRSAPQHPAAAVPYLLNRHHTRQTTQKHTK